MVSQFLAVYLKTCTDSSSCFNSPKVGSNSSKFHFFVRVPSISNPQLLILLSLRGSSTNPNVLHDTLKNVPNVQPERKAFSNKDDFNFCSVYQNLWSNFGLKLSTKLLGIN